MLLHLLKITWCLLPFTTYQRRQATIICKHFKILMQDIFIYSLVAPQPNANLCQGHSFTYPILITAYSDFYLKFNRKLLIRYVHECQKCIGCNVQLFCGCVCTNSEWAIPAACEKIHVNVSAYTFERIIVVVFFIAYKLCQYRFLIVNKVTCAFLSW